MRKGLVILFVSMLLASSASAAAEDVETATLPTGEEARPHAAVAADAPRVPDPQPDEAAITRSLSLAPGVPHLSSRFGWRGDPLGQGTRFHAGVDIPAHSGTAVRAVQAGRVVFAGWAGGYGMMVEIDHGGGVRSRYGHLEHAAVAVGELVEAHTVVGAIGSTGRSTGPHLHYEVRFGGRAVDPLRAAMTGRDVGMPDLSWPGGGPDLAEVSPRWFWRGAAPATDGKANELPAAVIR